MDHKFELGQKVKDVITGFKGVATARIEYLTGCTQYSVNPGLDKDGKLQDNQWFDEDRLVADGGKIKLDKKRSDGADFPAPVNRR